MVLKGDKAKEGNHKGQRVVNGWKNSNLPWDIQNHRRQNVLRIT